MKKSIMTISFLVGLLTLSLGGQNSAYAESNAQSPFVSANPDFHETICHFPGGNGILPKTIVVGSPSVLEAHLKHGDLYGECPIICPPNATSCFGADGTPGLVGYSTAGSSGSSGTTGVAGTTSPYSQRDLKGS